MSTPLNRLHDLHSSQLDRLAKFHNKQLDEMQAFCKQQVHKALSYVVWAFLIGVVVGLGFGLAFPWEVFK